MPALLVAAVCICVLLALAERKNREKVLYFAYGINTNEPYFKETIPSADYVGTATLQGYELVMYTHATVKPRSGSQVKGVLWRVSPDDMRELDTIEGGYERASVVVETNRKKVAQTYVMVKKERVYPEQNYVDAVEKGYEANDLDNGGVFKIAQVVFFSEKNI